MALSVMLSHDSSPKGRVKALRAGSPLRGFYDHLMEFRYPSRIRLAATASTVFFRFLPW